MFKIDKNSLTIKITRGDTGVFGVTATNDDGSDYTFQNGDTIRLAIYEKKNYESLMFEKIVPIINKTTEVEIELTTVDTTIGDIINKPVDYWYEIELNPDGDTQTIIGYDEQGPKIFKLYPEGVDE